MDIIDTLNHVHPLLRSRVRIHPDGAQLKTDLCSPAARTFVLYLPTVNLRFEHNPAFSLACHLANHFQLPLLVLVVVMDDMFLPVNSKLQGYKPIVMTCRRLAFWLEAIASAGMKWHTHGAGVAIRVHGPKCRYSDHLTLAVRSRVVITDEPFVHPFLNLVQSVERVCQTAAVPCFRVDGSTTVPPCTILNRAIIAPVLSTTDDSSHIFYSGVPAKAWMWQKQTQEYRKNHIQAVMNGAFDPPVLRCYICCSDFVKVLNHDFMTNISLSLPEQWRREGSSAPGKRPWMIHELKQLMDSNELRPWVLTWPGADPSVPPCSQTIGTFDAGMKRWDHWVRDRKGLIYYAQRR